MNERKPHEKDIQQILSLLNKEGYLFGFPKALEGKYRDYLKKRIFQRVPAVGLSSVIFLFIFAVLDVYFLPHDIATQTVAVRLLFAIPMIVIACLWLYFRPPKFYLWIYSSVFLIVGLSVVWIIWFAHVQGIWLPYEGLMIIMTYGFVVMALPITLAAFLNAIMVIAYALSEPLIDINLPVYINNVTFLLAMYLAGFVSAWILAYAQRGQFLHQYLLKLNQKQAKAEMQSRNRYLAAASHDLRQPMQAINMLLESLDHDISDERISKLRSASSNLSSMFTQLLDMSRINLDLMEINQQVMHIKPFLESIIASVQVRADAMGIDLQYQSEDDVVLSDPAALQRIISNLLQNALSHSQASQIKVTAKTWQDSLILTIEDNGKGIPNKEHERIFNAFSRLPGEKEEGLGLGLAIVRELAAHLGHDLKLISEQGTKFILTLPRATSTKRIDSHSQILIVEDDGALLSQYQQWFIRWGWQVFIAHSIEEAKHQLKHRPKWILTDMYLEDGNAQDLFTAIAAISEYHPNGILVSGSQQPEVQQVAERHHLLRLAKPLSPSRLRSALLSSDC